ncbi:MAG: hypothetical protein J0L64_15360 [Acidobacteria bacterium]|nr:hypothetical protein [Acidobacteriota bacterium]
MVPTTSPSLSFAGASRLLALTLAAALAASAQQSATLRVRPLGGQKLQSSVSLPSPSKLIVVVEDGLGAPIPSASVSFRLPEASPAGVFENGLRTEIATTGPDGRAATSAVRWPSSGPPVAVRVTAAKGDQRAGVVILVEGSKGPATALPTLTVLSSPAPATPPPADRIVPNPVVLGASIAPKLPPPVPVDLQVPKYEPPSFWRGKWVLVAVTAGGALTAGYFAARTRTSGAASVAPAPITPGSVAQIPVAIGPPTVIIGKP